MAVALDAVSSASTALSPLSWTHTPVATPSGVLVLTGFVGSPGGVGVGSVAYGTRGLARVGVATLSTGTENGECAAWFASDATTVPALTGAATSGTTNALNALTYSNGYWVSVGASGTIRYTTDPAGTWTTANSGTTNPLYAVAYGNGYWVAVGQNSTRYTTTLSSTWALQNSLNATLRGLVYANGYWVVGSSLGNIYYMTTPGSAWTLATSGFGAAVYGVAYADGYWVAVAANGAIYWASSTPNSTWSAATSGTTNALYAVAYGNGYWVAVGAAGTVVYATDPTGTWTTVSPSPLTSTTINSVIYANDQFIAVGAFGRAAYAATPNGIWNDVATDRSVGSEPFAVGHGGDYVVAVGASGVIRWGMCPESPTAIPTGAQTVWTARSNAGSTDAPYAGIAATLTGTYPLDVIDVSTVSGVAATLAEVNVNDGLLGPGSLRFAAVNSGLDAANLATTTTASDTLVMGANSTAVGTAVSRTTVDTFRSYPVSSTTISLNTGVAPTLTSPTTQSGTFVVAATMASDFAIGTAYPTTSVPPSGPKTWSIRYVVSAMTTPYEMRFKLQRRNLNATLINESPYGTVRAATGTYTDAIVWDSGTWATSDLLYLVWEHRRPSGSGNKSGTITLGGSSYIDAPAEKRVFAVARETTGGSGVRPVGFQSTTADETTAVYLAVREAIVPWTVGVPVR